MGYIRNVENMSDISEILALAEEKTTEGRKKLDFAVSSLLQSFENYQDRYESASALQVLLNKAAVELREMLAERLTLEENIPVQLLLALAYDDNIDVSEPVLRDAQCFDSKDWQSIIDKTTPRHWKIIAVRPDIQDPVVRSLLSKEDEETTIALLDNQSVRISQDMVPTLKKVAWRCETSHDYLLKRRDLGTKLISELYWMASVDLRQKIIDGFNIDIQTLDLTLENLVQELIDSSSGYHEVTKDIERLAKKYHERREITPQFLCKVLRRGQIAFFIALFSNFSGLQLAIAREIIIREGGQELATVCKAKSLMKTDFASFFLMTRAARPGEQRVSQGELSQALSVFDKITKEEAKKRLKSWGSNNLN